MWRCYNGSCDRETEKTVYLNAYLACFMVIAEENYNGILYELALVLIGLSLFCEDTQYSFGISFQLKKEKQVSFNKGSPMTKPSRLHIWT